MLDFWESMGRVVANENGLRDLLLGDAELTSPNEAVMSADLVTGTKRVESWSIPTAKYGKLEGLLSQYLTYKPVSAFSLGEWLRVLPSAKASDFGGVPKTEVNLTGRSAQFYAGLGAITVDDTFAAAFAADPATKFPLVTDAADVTDLQQIASDTNGFGDAAIAFCEGFWPPPCFVLVSPYSDLTAQVHPALQSVEQPPEAPPQALSASV